MSAEGGPEVGERWERVLEIVAEAAAAGKTVAVSATRLEDGARWSVDGGRVFPAASTIKVPVMVAVHRAAEAGRLALDAPTPIAAEDRVVGSGVLTWMSPDLRPTLADHVYLMIAISDNTATNVCIRAAGGLDAVNAVIADLGMADSRMGRLLLGRAPRPDEGDNHATPDDLVRALAAIAGDRAASPESCARMRGTLALQHYLDMLPRRMPPGVTFAGKSGFIPGLAHDSGIFSGPGGSLAAAVMTEGYADEFEAHETIGRIGRLLVEEAGIAG